MIHYAYSVRCNLTSRSSLAAAGNTRTTCWMAMTIRAFPFSDLGSSMAATVRANQISAVQSALHVIPSFTVPGQIDS